MTHDELIAVVTAHRDGKQIQLCYTTGWRDIDVTAYRLGELLSDEYAFRVKPNPRRGFVAKVRVYATREMAQVRFPDDDIIEMVEVVT